jgi:hypothetical protein
MPFGSSVGMLPKTPLIFRWLLALKKKTKQMSFAGEYMPGCCCLLVERL